MVVLLIAIASLIAIGLFVVLFVRSGVVKVVIHEEGGSTRVVRSGIQQFEYFLNDLLERLQQPEYLELIGSKPNMLTFAHRHRDPDACVDPFYTVATYAIEARFRKMGQVWRLLSRYRKIDKYKTKLIGFES